MVGMVDHGWAVAAAEWTYYDHMNHMTYWAILRLHAQNLLSCSVTCGYCLPLMKVRTAPEAQLLHGAPGISRLHGGKLLKMVYHGLAMSSLLAIQKSYKKLYVWQWKIMENHNSCNSWKWPQHKSDHLGSSTVMTPGSVVAVVNPNGTPELYSPNRET